ncbi:MAG: diaminopimelate epimerase [Lachnospiraceae bacterium]|nr:diaminopimelate epimerase [Lachnospiraceae bacterium]
MNTITLKKYHGLGNDYLVLDPAKNNINLQARSIELLCQRNFGVGADGILYGPIMKDGKIYVQIYNPDGSETEISGNGIRIFAKYLLDEGYVENKKFTIYTTDTATDIEFLDDEGNNMKANMGKASFAAKDVPVAGLGDEVIDKPVTFNNMPVKITCLTVGNPHCVIISDVVSPRSAMDIGPFIENAEYFPNRINVIICKIDSEDHITAEIFERGAGYTLASGTGSCAAAAACYKMGLTGKKVTVTMPGGDLEIEVDDDYSITMTGSVEFIGAFTVAENFFS